MAAEFKGLYRTDVAVQSKDESTRNEDIRRALEQVLKRLVRSDAMQSKAVGAMLEKPEQFVLQYEYISKPSADTPLDYLRVDFDSPRLNDALRKSNISPWGEQRPEVLVWLSIEENSEKSIFAADQMPEMDRTLRAAAGENGLPVTAPLWDLTDQQNLNFEDFETGNGERIRQASARYESDAVLAGRLSHEPDGTWDAVWRLYLQNIEETWQGNSPDAPAAIRSGIAGVYSRLAERFIPRTTRETILELKVFGLSSLGAIDRAASNLSGLSQVRKLEMLGVDADYALFKLYVRGDRASLEETLALGRVLRPVANEDRQFSGLTYQLAE
ncbi:DUF2066 domain-containing protein [Methylocaldum marinum]|nr:DUF2066 domain-containing protein [Methylocaldum marinum]